MYMIKDEIEIELKRMLGEHSYNHCYKIEEKFGKLAKSVDYLITQLDMLKKDINDEYIDKNDKIFFIDEIEKNCLDILKNEV